MKYTSTMHDGLLGFLDVVNQDLDTTNRYNHPEQLTSADNSSSKKQWAGGTLDDALVLASQGWSGRPDLSSLSKSLLSATTGEIPSFSTRNDVSGSFVDVGLYLTGEPECMVEFEPLPTPRVVRVGFNLATSAELGDETFRLRGALVLSLVNQLTTAGYGVELIVYNLVKGSRKPHTDSYHLNGFVLKRGQDVLDMDALAFWCAHKAAKRRLIFAHQEREDIQKVRKPLGFGYSFGGYGMTTSLDHCKPAKEELNLDVDISCSPQTSAEASKIYDELIGELAL